MENRGQRTQYLIALCLSVGSVCVGCYASWMAPVIPKFIANKTDFTIATDEIAWMVSLSSPGFMAGCYLSRSFSDKFGRQATAFGSVIPLAVGSIIIVYARVAWLFYIAKFMWGLGTGLFNVSTSIYLAEIANKEIRGALSLISRCMFNFGNLLLMCLGPFISYDMLNYLMVVFPLAFVAVSFWVPESPYYLLKEGKVDKARKSLVVLRGHKNEADLEQELHQMRSEVKNDMRRDSSIKELFTGKQYRRAVIIAFGLKLTQILTGQLVIQQYLGIVIMESHISLTLATTFIIYGGVRFIVGALSSMLADRVGRRPLLIYSYFGTFASLAVVGLFFFVKEVLTIDNDALSPYGIILFIAILMSNVISTLGYYSIIVVIPAEIFPLNVKAVAMTCVGIFGAALNFFVARGFQIIKDWIGLTGVFWFFAGIALIGAIFSVLMVPETKGKSFRDIQIMMQGDLYEEDEAIQKLNLTEVKDAVIDTKDNNIKV